MLKPVRLYLPLVLLSFPWLVTPLVTQLPRPLTPLLSILPLLLFGVALVLAAGFKRTRLALATTHLGFCTLLLSPLVHTGLDRPDAYVLHTLLGITLCLVQGWVLLQRDSSLFCRRGLITLTVTVTPYLILAFFWLRPGALTPLLIQFHPLLLEQLQPQLLLSKGVGWLAMPVLAFSLLLTLTRRTADEVALFGALLALLAAMACLNHPTQGALLLLVAPLLLGQAVVSHIYAMAFIDPLTGVPARRALEYRLASLGRHYGIAMLDIDHFKDFNDRYGHDVGDQVLRMVATQLKQVDAGGRLYRYGGEEFTIVFSGQQRDAMAAALEAVRERVAHYPMQVRSAQRPRDDTRGQRSRQGSRGQKQVQVTISIGLAWSEADARPSTVLQRADKALYRAKRSGRNRLAVDGQDPRQQRRTA